MGRVYHYLLLEAKYLGTYYTSVPAATLLLKLALSPSKWSIDWTNLEDLRQFHAADLACGTGTLLMAVSQAITDNFVRASAQQRKSVDGESLKNLHRVIMEDVIHGYDVLPSAVHLTASTLALLAPEIAFRKMQLYSMPMGKLADGSIYLGSIEFLRGDRVQTQLDLMGETPTGGVAGSLSGQGTSASVAPLPSLDLCVMNPPFVRSVNSNLLFGSMPLHRREMQDELAHRLRNDSVMASSTAGLGAVFAAIGDLHLKGNGRLALVLPAALTTGGAWSKTRALIDNGYQLEFIVASHDAERWSFSENTELSEVLLVARKLGPGERRSQNGECTFVNLWRNPRGTAEALSVGEAMAAISPMPVGNSEAVEHGVASLVAGRRKFGEVVSIPVRELFGQPWLGGAFAQTEMVRANWLLRKGNLTLPGAKQTVRLPLCALQALGHLGPDGRDIHDGFTHSSTRTAYAAFWNHDADSVLSLNNSPNLFLSPRSRPAEGRPRRPAELLWPKSARVMVAVRLRFNTHRLVAIRVEEPALSNVWYPVKLHADSADAEKALVLWLNSTLGVLLLSGHRVPTQGSWVQFKKPTWNPMPVLDLRALDPKQLSVLAGAYDRLAEESLLPLRQLDEDPVREDIDLAFQTALGIPDTRQLRRLLAQEPILRNSALGVEETEEAEDLAEQFELLLNS